MLGWRLLTAIRLFRASSANQLISFLGLLSIGGLVLAVAVLVTVLSVMNGFERELKDRVLAIVPHGVLYLHRGEHGSHPWLLERRARQLAEHPLVRGVAPMVEGNAMLVKDGNLQGVSFKGVDHRQEGAVSILPTFMKEGSFAALEKPFAILIGAPLARTLGVELGDRVTLVLPEVRFGLAGASLTTKAMTVQGIFETGADLDKTLALVSLNDAKRLKRQTQIDGFTISTEDIFAAPALLRQLGRALDLAAHAWNRTHGNLYDAIQTQKATMFMLLLILVGVAAFNLVSNLVMTVDDSKGKIAILRTLGASPGHVRQIFMLHGLLVGALGVLLGLVAGLLLAFGLAAGFEPMMQLLNMSPMDEYFVRYLPVQVVPRDLALIGLVSLGLCLLATVYPAGRAAKAKPAQALAHEV